MIAVSMRPGVRGSVGPQKMNINKAQMDGMPEIEPISVGDIVRSLEG